MSSVAYPSYSDSKIQWIGKIPNHWKVLPLYAMAIERDQSNKGMLEDNLLSLSYGRIIRKDMSSNDGLLPESFETYQIVCPGDIVFRLTDLQNDKRSLRSALVEERGIITSAYVAIAPQGTDSRYLSFLFRAYDVTKVFYSMGGGLRQAMKYDDLKRLPVVMPPLAEQVSIAHFLDQETSKIDALISEQRRLIELLKEKRQAVVSHAVTKGLNPDVRMKPSGVEWLGEVPEHWQVKRLKYVCQLLTSNIDKKTVEGEVMIRLCNYTDVYYNEKILCNLPFMEASATESQVEKFTLRKGDTIITKDSESPDDIAIPSYVPKNLPGVVCGYHLAILRPFVALDGLFLSRLFQSNYIKAVCAVGANGLTRYGLSQAAITDLELPMPPLDEQTKIASFLEETTGRIDSLVADAVKTVSLLQERRTALISAAVTGKIDVRNYAATQKDAA